MQGGQTYSTCHRKSFYAFKILSKKILPLEFFLPLWGFFWDIFVVFLLTINVSPEALKMLFWCEFKLFIFSFCKKFRTKRITFCFASLSIMFSCVNELTVLFCVPSRQESKFLPQQSCLIRVWCSKASLPLSWLGPTHIVREAQS